MTPSDVKIVADNINDFIEVPDGINRLRKAVLTLAVSGQLVEQNENEGTADELYAQLKAEHDKIEETSRKKKTKKLHPISDEEVPFDIPKSWKWVRLGDVTNYGSTDKSKPSDLREGVWVLELEDLEKNGGRLLSVIRYPARLSLSDKNVFKRNDVLYGKLRPYLNKVIVAMEDGVSSSELLPIRWSADPEFLRLVLLSDYFSSYVNSITYGVKMPRLGTEDGRNALFPLAPLSEQARIVKRVNEVMKQLDELESQKNERDLVRSRLTQSAMQALGSGDSNIAFAQLTELIKTTSDIDELEKAIRSLSVFGYLTSKPNGEDIPSNWKWIDWGDLLSEDKYSMKRGPFGSALRKDFFVSEGVKVYEQYNAIHDVDRERYFISDEKYKELEAFTVRPGDLIISCSGTLGRIAELHKDSKIGIINQALLKITLNQKLVSNEYFILLFRSDFIQKRIYDESLGTAMTNMVNVKTLKKIALPIPSTEEQKQIVRKFNELGVKVNELKKIIN